MAESPGSLFNRLVEIMGRLRAADGCPWDREQTRASLKPYLIEEAYEVLDALEASDPTHLEEELGDLLFQVIFHARLASELGEFTIAGVLARLIDKMVSRHPHVFGDASVATPQEALTQWERLKRQEAATAGRDRSALDGVPRALPALLRAQRLQAKASRVGFDWPDPLAAWAKVEEEVRETAAVLTDTGRDRLTDELGDLLFSLVNVARLAGLDAEDVLSRANEKFRRRFADMERDLYARGKSMDNISLSELERSWEAAKAQERLGQGQE
jgi:MazG family protein